MARAQTILGDPDRPLRRIDHPPSITVDKAIAPSWWVGVDRQDWSVAVQARQSGLICSQGNRWVPVRILQ